MLIINYQFVNYQLLLGVHSLTRGDGNHVIDVINRAATRQIVYWTGDTLKNRTDSDSVTQTLNQLIADISNLEVREYKYVSLTSNL